MKVEHQCRQLGGKVADDILGLASSRFGGFESLHWLPNVFHSWREIRVDITAGQVGVQMIAEVAHVRVALERRRVG